jgi:4-hydroxybenzoate polyprenyltransferase
MHRPAREIGVVAGAALLTQLLLGLLNDVCDRSLDLRAGNEAKPIAVGVVPVGNATWLMAVCFLLAVPMSLQSGSVAGLSLLATLPVGLLHNRWLHRTPLSFLGWAATFALYPAFLAYGGWGGGMHGSPPTLAITGAAAGLGVCVHLLTSLPDLVADNRAGIKPLPLVIALRTGAPRLLVLTSLLTVVALAALAVVALGAGVRQ